ncbi:hypothetical protein [Paenibacillus sp. sgz302251]|uniref:hypothetical protein n=1 Tax=Paenibacillus sp. sgz302251 TaxID=3414493 RepID=UPI003C7A56D2
MGKVYSLTASTKQQQKTNHKKQSLFRQALSELKKETGIDHYAVITGNEKENKRLKFKHYQEKLLEG